MKRTLFVFWLLIALAIPSYVFYQTGWQDGVASGAKVVQRMQQDLEIATTINQNCDRALISCQGWQARVGLGLDNVEKACVTTDVIIERLKALLEQTNAKKPHR